MQKGLLVYGHRQHGKDSACEYLAQAYGLMFSSSSLFACERFLFESMRLTYGYQTIEECYADRDQHREYWFNAIANYNHPDPTKLGRELYAQYDIYCGIRNDVEFNALVEAGLIKTKLWVDASKRKPLEPATSMKLTQDTADYVIDNNLPFEHTIIQIDSLMAKLGYKKIKPD